METVLDFVGISMPDSFFGTAIFSTSTACSYRMDRHFACSRTRILPVAIRKGPVINVLKGGGVGD